MIKRIIQYSELKPEKVQEYIELHAHPWPEILEVIHNCNIRNYSISIRGTELYTYYEYTGNNYEKDMALMEENVAMNEWWKHTKPCFLYHEKEHYYDELKEIFFLE